MKVKLLNDCGYHMIKNEIGKPLIAKAHKTKDGFLINGNQFKSPYMVEGYKYFFTNSEVEIVEP